MIWDTVKGNAGKAANFNHWPNPVNWVVNIDVLMCNQDYWLARIELAFATAADFFWTNLVPSPRELERKFLLGGYRCGFYVNIKVKSPMRIVAGKGASTVIVEIVQPFTKFLFYWWAQQTILESIAAWMTVLYPELYCVENVGKVYNQNSNAPIVTGTTAGTTAFPTHTYDPFHLALPLEEGATLGAGPAKVTAAWFFTVGNVPIDSIKTGWTVNGIQQDIQDLPGGGLGSDPHVVRTLELPSYGGGVIQPWFSAHSGSRVIPATASVITAIYDGHI